jgi:UDP-N-acetyl-D-galactosamine dehydrogenase
MYFKNGIRKIYYDELLNTPSDFKVGYSPERINSGDKEHRLETIVKIVSGMDEEMLDTIEKVIENSKRNIKIAFMNELSIIFNKMGYHSQSFCQEEKSMIQWANM